MAEILFANNASSTLAAPISPTTTSLVLSSGTGIIFPQPGAGEYFIGTLVNATNSVIKEIVWCTNVSTDTLTIVRAQEGTTALSWNAGDFFYNFWTAGSAASMLQASVAFQETYGGNGGGTANAQTIANLPLATSYTAIIGVVCTYIPGFTNTGPATLNVNGLGPINWRKSSSSGLVALAGNELQANQAAAFFYDGTSAVLLSSGASANIGTLGNVLTGTLPNPGLGSGVIVDANIAAATITGDKIAGATISGGNLVSSINLPGVPTAATAALGTANVQIATTAFANPASLLSIPGYVKLSSGLILQWGLTGLISTVTTTVTYPIAFPNAVLAAYAVPSLTPPTSQNQSAGVDPISTSQLIILNCSSATVSFGCYWLAIGW